MFCSRTSNNMINEVHERVLRVLLNDHESDFEKFQSNIPKKNFSLRKKCPYLELFWSAFFSHFPVFGLILCISPYSVRMRENARKMLNRTNPNTYTFYTVFVSTDKRRQPARMFPKLASLKKATFKSICIILEDQQPAILCKVTVRVKHTIYNPCRKVHY